MKKIKLKISGMHCSSCAMDIDGELEDTEGIEESNTNFARQSTEVSFDPKKISSDKIISIIKELNYDASVI